MRKPKPYNFSTEAVSQYGPQQVYTSFFLNGDKWFFRVEFSGQRIELPAEVFESIACNHLRQQGYTMWSPDERLAAYAMAHMAGFLGDSDELKWNK